MQRIKAKSYKLKSVYSVIFMFMSPSISKVSRMDYAEISVDPKFHRHLIGKGGVNSK